MSNEKNKKSIFLLQGSILAATGIIVRLIGLFYRIPMISIMGAKGNGYYTSAYNVYSLFLILSSYSFPTAISKVLSTRFAQNRFYDAKNVIRISFGFAFFVGSITFLITFFGADVISLILRKPLLCFSLRALSPTLFIMAFLGVYRGIFQGMGNMVPTAISQFFEQVANAITSILFAFILFQKGKIASLVYDTEEYKYAFSASGGAIGTGIGALTALIILFLMYRNFSNKYKNYFTTNGSFEIESKKSVYSSLFFTILPIIVSSTIYNITAVLDDVLFSNVMAFMGSTDTIVILLGVFGQYHLLFNIPVAIANSITSSIIPSISHSVALNDGREVVLKTNYSIKYTMLIVLPAFIGLVVLAEPICLTLFPGNNVDLLINLVKYGSIAVVFFSLSTVTNGILQGLGLFNKTVKNALIALIFHMVFCIILLIPFKLNIYAVVYSMILFSIVLFLLNNHDIGQVVRYSNNRYKIKLLINYFFMFISAAIMGLIIYLINKYISMTLLPNSVFIKMIFRLILCILIAIFIYIPLIIILGVVRKRDSEYIPFISKFSWLLRY